VRFLVGGCDETRRRNFQWGWSAVIDETMFAWRGKGGTGGMPHLSHVPRKPEDLGCELKTACDGTSGVMMHVETQEGKLRMARKQWHQECGATTSCTLRCFKEPGFAEAHRPPEERGQGDAHGRAPIFRPVITFLPSRHRNKADRFINRRGIIGLVGFAV
jgi:hypothetical protein